MPPSSITLTSKTETNSEGALVPTENSSESNASQGSSLPRVRRISSQNFEEMLRRLPSSPKELIQRIDRQRNDIRLLQEENLKLKSREVEVSALTLRLQQQFSATQNQVASLKRNIQLQLANPITEEEYNSIEALPEAKRDLLDTVKLGIYRQLGSLQASAQAAARLLRRKRVLFTTGMRLSQTQERLCGKLGFVVNPSLSRAKEASLLVVQGPLMRSVKLLTVLPYIKLLVDRRWFDDMLAQGNPLLPVEPYAYAENKRKGGIERANGFSIESALSIPLEQRQRLFKSHTFWIHPSALPQEPPMNDLHTVLTASGGKISEKIMEASVWVLPSRKPSAVSMRIISKALNGEEDASRRFYGRSSAASDNDMPLSRLMSSATCMVVPDDIFRSVLQQRDLSKFALRIGNVISKLSVMNTKERIYALKQKASTRVAKVLQV